MERAGADPERQRRRGDPLEHTPLRDAIVEAGCYRIDDGYISPPELVALGVALGIMSAEESKRLHDLECASAQAS